MSSIISTRHMFPWKFENEMNHKNPNTSIEEWFNHLPKHSQLVKVNKPLQSFAGDKVQSNKPLQAEDSLWNNHMVHIGGGVVLGVVLMKMFSK